MPGSLLSLWHSIGYQYQEALNCSLPVSAVTFLSPGSPKSPFSLSLVNPREPPFDLNQMFFFWAQLVLSLGPETLPSSGSQREQLNPPFLSSKISKDIQPDGRKTFDHMPRCSCRDTKVTKTGLALEELPVEEGVGRDGYLSIHLFI